MPSFKRTVCIVQLIYMVQEQYHSILSFQSSSHRRPRIDLHQHVGCETLDPVVNSLHGHTLVSWGGAVLDCIGGKREYELCFSGSVCLLFCH